MTAVRKTRPSAALWAGAIFALPALGWTLFSATGRDDAYITYWAARTLAREGSILNYNGDQLEQSSSLLHTLLLALGEVALPFSIPAIGYALGIAFGIGTVMLAGRIADRIRPGSGHVAALLVGTSAYIVYWAFGGMETTIVSFTTLLGLSTADGLVRAEGGWRPLAAFALAALAFTASRPESGLVLICVVVGIAAVSVAPFGPRLQPAPRKRGVWLALGAAIGVFGILTAGRYAYFGAAFPQPVSSKSRGLPLEEGLAYLGRWLPRPYVLVLILLLIPAAIFSLRSLHSAAAFVWMALLANVGFAIAAGGDWMEAGRLLVPAMALVSILVASFVATLPRAGLIAAALVLIQLVGVADVARRDSTGKPVWSEIDFAAPASVIDGLEDLEVFERVNRVHVRDGAFVDELEAFVRELPVARPVIASGQAGMVPYYLLQRLDRVVRFIDLGSLTTDDFDRCPGGVSHSVLGAGITLNYWVDNAGRCGLPLPDAIYQLATRRSEKAIPDEYVVIYRQPSVSIKSGSSVFAGGAVPAGIYVAVRRDLLAPMRRLEGSVTVQSSRRSPGDSRGEFGEASGQ